MCQDAENEMDRRSFDGRSIDSDVRGPDSLWHEQPGSLSSLDFLFGSVSLKLQRAGTVQESVKKPASLISPGNRLLAGLVMLMIA